MTAIRGGKVRVFLVATVLKVTFMRYVFVLVLTLTVSAVAVAGQQVGQITSLRVTSKAIGSPNPTHFSLSGAASGQPGCVSLAYWTFDADTPTGKNFLATLLTAQATGRSVAVYGTNNCDLRSGMEGVIEIDLAP